MIPEPLLEQIQRRKCLLFLGAGFSLNIELPEGKTMPEWRQLTQKLKQGLTIEPKPDEPLDIASEYAREFDKNNLISKMSELLHVDIIQPGEAHKKLTKIRALDTIITTNFEFLIERAYENEKLPVRVIVGDENISQYSPNTHTNIIKIHGDFRNYSKIVVTKKDYDEFMMNFPILSTNISAWFSTRVALFIGYSLNDPHFQQIRRMLKERLGDLTYKGYIVKFDATEEEIKEFDKDNLFVINLKTNGKSKQELLLEFLCEIQDFTTIKDVGTFVISKQNEKEGDVEFLNVSKDISTGKVINSISNFEEHLKIALEKFGWKSNELRRSISFLINQSLTHGILNKEDISQITRVREIRNSIAHTSNIPTKDEVQYVEDVMNEIIKKISELQVTKVDKDTIIMIATDKKKYSDGETIKIHGKINRLIEGTPLTVLIKNPHDNLVYIESINLDKTGSFESNLIVSGPLWTISGEYTIMANYPGVNNPAISIFQYTKQVSSFTQYAYEIDMAGKSFDVSFLLNGGLLRKITPDKDFSSLIISLDAYSEGEIRINLPRQLIDSVFNGKDDKFIIICNGDELKFTENKTKEFRELIISFPKGENEIEIIGSHIYGSVENKQDSNIIEILEGSSAPRDDEKYLKPHSLVIKSGQTVKWINNDISAHTITSGTPEEGPNGKFDSSVFLSNVTFQHTFNEKGTYRYYCMIHPWKEGKIIVT